jgi:transcriptional accessory protein Tex/SPT6
LDNSAVHPESYRLVQQMAKAIGVKAGELVGNPSNAKKLSAEEFVTPLSVSALAADTGYAPQTQIDVGIQNFVDWYKSYYA